MRAGSLPRLVERLTHPAWLNVGYRDAFLLTFRSFTNPTELLSLLIERYHSVDVAQRKEEKEREEESEKGKKEKEKESVGGVQLKVMGVLKAWIEQTDDFVTDSGLVAQLDTLLQGVCVCVCVCVYVSLSHLLIPHFTDDLSLSPQILSPLPLALSLTSHTKFAS